MIRQERKTLKALTKLLIEDTADNRKKYLEQKQKLASKKKKLEEYVQKTKKAKK